MRVGGIFFSSSHPPFRSAEDESEKKKCNRKESVHDLARGNERVPLSCNAFREVTYITNYISISFLTPT